jgi:methionine-rich copper-binding protein CopC
MTNYKLLRATPLLLSLLFSNMVWAHAHPKLEVPADGAAVSAPPEVSIVFDDALEPALSSLSVSDAQSHSVTNAKAELDAATHKTLSLKLPTLVAGSYLVKWVAVSLDGHRTSGSYRFTVK